MEINNLTVGSLVYITSYGPFHGLKGIIRAVDIIAPPDEQGSLCFYLVALHERLVKEPLWLVHEDVAEVEGDDVRQWSPSKKKVLSRAEAEALEIITSGFEKEERKQVSGSR